MQGHRDILPLGLFPLGLRVLDGFRSFCRMKEFGDGFDGVIFPTLIDIVAETAIVSFHALPVGFPLPTISKNSLYTLFCPLILDHGVSFILSVPGLKNSFFVYLARYFFSPLSSICDNQVLFSSDESPGHTIPIRS